jgi:hypothetical protein
MIIGLDEFKQGNPVEIYSQMRPDQRTAVANEFVRMFYLRCDEAAPRFGYAAHDPLAGRDASAVPASGTDTVVTMRPALLTAEQAAEIHRYALDRCPDAFDAVARHPVTMAALAWPGAPVDEEPIDGEMGAHEAGKLPTKPSASLLSAERMTTPGTAERHEEGDLASTTYHPRRI